MIARTVWGLTLALLVSTATFAQQLAPLPKIPAIPAPGQTGSHRPDLTITIPKRPAPVPVVIHMTGSWTEYLDNRLVENTEVRGEDWPAAAREVIARSGVQPSRRLP